MSDIFSPAAQPALPRDLLALRERAETRRRLVTQATNQHTAEDLQRLVQELQIHQIELEMQYEELLVAQAETQAVQARYVDLYDFAPVGYLTLAANGLVEQLNLCAAQLLGTTRRLVLERRFLVFVAPEGRATFLSFLAAVLATDQPQRCELALVGPEGPPRYVQLQGSARPTAQGGQPQCQLVVIDVDERRRHAAATVASEVRFRASFEQSNDGMLLLEDHKFADLNAAALRLLGVADKAQVVGRHVALFWPEFQPDGRRTISVFSACLARAVSTGWCRIELLRERPDGQLMWDELSFDPVLVQGQPLVHVIWRDITERKRLAEEVLQQRLHEQQAVLAAILETQETERKRIAEALHNGVGQLLYATRLSLEIKKKGPLAPPASLDLLNEAIRATRTISFELTPGVLEDFGLRTALEELVKRIAPSHLPVQLHFAGLPQRLPAPVEIAAYRIIQELINNVLKHARATEATVYVVCEAGKLEISVEDNGCGFAPATLAAQPLTGIGLAGVRNRVALLGGTLDIQAQPGRGTIVSIEVEV